MSDSLCFKFWCNLFSKIYLTINLATLILLYFLQRNKFYEDGCFLQKVYYSELNSISQINWSSFKTNDSLQLGYLEEYSGKYTKISSKKIYKWENEYINVKREKIKLKRDLAYTIIDIKVSFKTSFDFNYKRNSNICFSKECLAKDGSCKMPLIYPVAFYKESTNNFIKDNDIQISSKNIKEIYDPGVMYLFYIYRRFDQKEGQTNFVNIYKRTLLSILILNPILRFLKLFLLSIAQVGKKERCTWINAFFSIFHTINATLLLVITIYYRNYQMI